MTKKTNDDRTPHRKFLKIKETEVDGDARVHEVHEIHMFMTPSALNMFM
jgi:hypothetical protein